MVLFLWPAPIYPYESRTKFHTFDYSRRHGTSYAFVIRQPWDLLGQETCLHVIIYVYIYSHLVGFKACLATATPELRFHPVISIHFHQSFTVKQIFMTNDMGLAGPYYVSQETSTRKHKSCVCEWEMYSFYVWSHNNNNNIVCEYTIDILNAEFACTQAFPQLDASL